jgi:hypothetical protein
VKNPVHQEIELIITLASGHTRSNRNLRFEDNNLKEARNIRFPLTVEACKTIAAAIVES